MKKLRTIYEYFSDFSYQEVNSVIKNLSIEEQNILNERYGPDLTNPVVSNWNREKSNYFYKVFIPKFRRLLTKRRLELYNIANKNVFDINNNIPLLLELINQGLNNKEICQILHINSKQLYGLLLNLKTLGVSIGRKYYYDGYITYEKINTAHSLEVFNTINKECNIITKQSVNNLKFLVISDLHFGNNLARLDLIERVFNYCINNNIHVILCGGDIIDGTYTAGEQSIPNVYKQMEYFIENYPSDDSILTFGVIGNHDLSVLHKESLNIMEVCNNYRHDVVIGGYNSTKINLKNDQILLCHSNKNIANNKNIAIILHGHLHKYAATLKNNTLDIAIPTLSNICELMPSSLELDINFDNGYIVNTIVKQIYFGTKDIVLNEVVFNKEKDNIEGRKRAKKS